MTTSESSPVTGVVVVVPAHNEQLLIAACLQSLADAQDMLCQRIPQITCDVVVVLDDCDDDSDIIAGRMNVSAMPVAHHNVGAARRAGVQAALAHSRSPLRQTWVANTDADCRVPRDWLLHFVEAAERGYHMVLGMVCPSSELSQSQLHAWHRRHPYVDGHPHVHGANLGIRADVYEAIGGWSPLRTGEDAELVARAESSGTVRILRTGQGPVWTSSRLVGRAPAGFADYLSTLPGSGDLTEAEGA